MDKYIFIVLYKYKWDYIFEKATEKFLYTALI